MERNRREERAARAILCHAESALTRAATALFRGNPLNAMRGARLVEQLIALDRELEATRAEDQLRRAEYRQRQRDLDDRAEHLDKREEELHDAARKLRDFCELYGLNHEAISGLVGPST